MIKTPENIPTLNIKGRDQLIHLIKEVRQGSTVRYIQAKQVFEYLKGIYDEEFGHFFVNKEILLSKEHIDFTMSKFRDKVKTIDQAVEFLFIKAEEELKEGFTQFVSSKQVSAQQFCDYSKGLYWMAGFKLLE